MRCLRRNPGSSLPQKQMNKLYLFLTFLLVFAGGAQAQQYGNEWINYSQVYVKIPITQKGIFRIYYSDLQAKGFPVSGDPRNFQLFRRGVEQAIYVQGEADGVFSSGEYIEFYGVPNDGARDKEWYDPQTARRGSDSHTNPYVSLFTDESYYFLTVKTGGGAVKRMANPTPPSKNGLTAEPYHNEEVIQAYSNYYHVGPAYNADYSPTKYQLGISLSQYDIGKGYLQDPVKGDPVNNVANVKSYSLALTNPVTNQPGVTPSLSISIYGATLTNHNLNWSVGPDAATQTVIQNFTFSNYALQNGTQSVGWDKFGASSGVMKLVSAAAAGDQVSLIYYKFGYPQQLNLSGVSAGKAINLRANGVGNSLVQLANATAGDQIYDITDPDGVQRITGTLNATTLETVVGNTTQARKLWVSRAPVTVTQSSIAPVSFQNINAASYNYLIVTNKALQVAVPGSANPVQDYANYRASAAGGSHSPLIVNIDLISDQFNYGEKSGLAIRRFTDFMLKNGTPKHLFLIGRGVYAQYFRQSFPQSTYDAKNFVPTGGWPGSDWMLVNGLNGKPANVPSIAVGRLNITTSEQVVSYLNKIKEYESAPFDLWRKNFLDMSGGHTLDERVTFKGYAQNYANIQANSLLGGKGSIISKETDAAIETINISAQVNSGLSFITFFGHSGANHTDINVGKADTLTSLTNQGKYPIMFINGCEAGNIFLDGQPETLGSSWINTANKGSIAFIGNTFLGWPSYLNAFSTKLFSNFGSMPNQTFGTVLVKTVTDYMDLFPNNAMGLGHALDAVVQGDPAIIPFPISKPDFSINKKGNFYKIADNLVDKDSVRFGLVISNFGIVPPAQMNVVLQRSTPGGRTTATNIATFTFNPTKQMDSLFITIPKSAFPVNTPMLLTAVVDPNNLIDESKKDNNTSSGIAFEITAALPVRLISFTGSIVDGKTAVLTGIDPARIPEQVGLLRWNTASEETLNGYTLEKTMDFKAWTSVGFVPAKNAASVFYSLYDPTLQVGNTYYRLKIHEQNDPDHYSPTISLQLAPTYDMKAFPNPAHRATTVSVREVNPGTSPVQVSLYSTTGALVWKGTLTGGKTDIPTAELTDGVYQIQVQDGIATHTRKLVVRHK
ncbi:Por secretion system C-terminal sorting domain-containing protein [Siphonobacter aquaeclarae]|uniref:Por secretion system C-terminal sorting domain-containing protein n=2 Tax=Siphonobacter aquaeclarae TaxID=563176 RepID=A0A1G9YJ38_9BACT|nr:Por secretion system C-terminal sorting domain-containing protein [Siphonobacter aquaeclarae]